MATDNGCFPWQDFKNGQCVAKPSQTRPPGLPEPAPSPAPAIAPPSPPPLTAAPPPPIVCPDGASNVAGKDPQGADGEVLLDIEVAGSVAPGATQVVYFAPNTDQGFLDAVTNAAHAQRRSTAVRR